jgi:hypothetical protein
MDRGPGLRGKRIDTGVKAQGKRRRARMPTSPYRSRKLSCLYFISGESR